MNNEDQKELNFLKGYLSYLKVEDPLFKPLVKKYNELKNKIDNKRKEQYKKTGYKLKWNIIKIFKIN